MTVANVGNAPSSGTVTVTETPPAGLTITALVWHRLDLHSPSTDLHSKRRARPVGELPSDHGDNECRRQCGAGHVANIAVVSGGGDPGGANNTASDPTVITSPPSPPSAVDFSIAKVHSPVSAAPGQTVTFTVTVTNVGNTPSSGTVTVIETPPAGLTISAISGTGWTCTVATRTCTRSDALAPTASYPVITVTTSVGAGVAPGTLTNSAAVEGGGDPNGANNAAGDPIIITPRQ